MRLRRETGDFQITINSENAVNTIRKGLSAEDFVGELVNVNGTYEVVNSANDTETGAEFKTNSFTLTYTKATGVITAQEGGSGSGGGSKSIFLVNEVNESQTAGRWVGTTIAPNLTLEELADYLWYIEAGGMWMMNPVIIPQSQTTEGKIIVNVTIPSSGAPSLVPIPYDIATGEIATEWSD